MAPYDPGDDEPDGSHDKYYARLDVLEESLQQIDEALEALRGSELRHQ